MDDGFASPGFRRRHQGFGFAFIDHVLKDGDLLWFQKALLQGGLPA
jgi:hypothetical protein